MKRSVREVEHPQAQPLETAYHTVLAYVQDLEDEVKRHRQVEAGVELRTTRLALINGIGRRIASILNLDDLLLTTCRLIQEMFSYDHVGIYLARDNYVELKAAAGAYADPLAQPISYKFEEGLIGAVAAQAEKAVIHDVRVDPRYIPLTPTSSTRAELCLPISIGEQLLGVLDIQCLELYEFDQAEILALEALTHQIAVALENARLHQAIQRELLEREETERVLQRTLEQLQIWTDERAPDLKRANQLLRHQILERQRAEAELRTRAHQQAIVANFGQRILSTRLDLPTLLDQAVKLVANTLNVEYSQVLELQPEVDNVLLLRAGVGWQPGLVGSLMISADADSQMGYTLLSSEPVIVENTHIEQRFRVSKYLQEHGIISSISVIIDGENWPFGVIGVHTTQARIFTKDDINFLQSVANILAQVIERVLAENALRESEEKYRTLIEKSSEAIYLIYGGRFEVINHRFTELFGVTQEQANSPDFAFTNIIASRDSRKLLAHLHQPGPDSGRGFGRPPYEFTAIDKDGNEIEIELSVSYPTYRGGLATQGLIRDITERKRIEQERQTAYEQAQQYATELSQKIVEVQRQREIATNLAEVVASVSLTLSTDEILNHILLKLKQLIPYDSAAIFLIKDDDYLVMEAAQGFDEQVVNQEQTFTKNLLFQELRSSKSYIHIPDTRKDERYQFWSGATDVRSWIGAPLLVAQDMIGYLTVDRYEPDALDLEDAQLVQAFAHQVAQTIYNARLFEQLHETQSQLIQRERLAALGQMAATVAHELRNPLMAIKIGVEYLVHDIAEDDPRRRGAALMQSNMERIDRIIDDILYVARAPKPNLTPGPLYSVLDNEVAYWEVNLAERNISFTHTLDNRARPIMLDFDQLGRVFSNLIGNAADAVGAGGQVSVKMSCEDGYQSVTVEDNGPGIPPESQTKIFEPFFTTKSRGTGLGLAIVKQIIENHRGQIFLWSEPGVGTSFTIKLPQVE